MLLAPCSLLLAALSMARLTSQVANNINDAQQLCCHQSAEPGGNLLYTSYNGLPFDVGAKWIEAVPVSSQRNDYNHERFDIPYTYLAIYYLYIKCEIYSNKAGFLITIIHHQNQERGIFCGEFVTPPQCAVINLRLGLARRILMPGYGIFMQKS